jgi:enamine deaminase RidA (YjgF/YER057c/UK114 family)
MRLIHVNPTDTYETLQSRGFTQVVVAEEIKSLIVISGQLPVDTSGKLVGQGDIETQVRAVYENLRRSLKAVGADFSNVLRMTTYLTDRESQNPVVRKVRAQYFGRVTPPASTMFTVKNLAPGVLLEVDALAAL